MNNYPLRLPNHVMTEVRNLAEASGISLNQFLSSLVAERVGEMKALAKLEARVARANPKAAMAVLARAPKRKPLVGDEMPKAKTATVRKATQSSKGADR